MQMIAGYTEHAADVRGLRMHYLEWGDAAAPPFVLLHGLTGHAHIWDHMAPELARRYHLIAPDQRGHGNTSRAEHYETREFAADLEELRSQLGIECFVLMGLSMGGHNAMAYAAAHPERIAALIVIDIPPKMDRTQSPNYAENAKLAETGHVRFATFDQAVANARAGTPTAPEDNLRYRTWSNLAEQPDGTLMFKYDPNVSALWDPEDLSGVLPSLKMPVLLVRGERTTVLRQDVAAEMLAAFPDADFVEIPESGHSVPTDRPEDLTPVVLQWLARRGF